MNKNVNFDTTRKNFGYKFAVTLPIKEGIEFILNIPLKKYESINSSRKYILAQLAQTSTKCACCSVVGTKFCLGTDKGGGKHWDLYTEDDIALSVDHMIPKSKDGSENIANKQILCVRCNWLKSDVPERLIAYKIILDNYEDAQGFQKGYCRAIHAKRSYIKIGYWKKLTDSVFNLVSDYLIEEEFEDEDCGTLYAYYFKN